jgi:hypothetical protein
MTIKINNYEIHPSKNEMFFDLCIKTEKELKILEYGVPLKYLLLKLAHQEVNSRESIYTLKEYVNEITKCIKKYLNND